MARITITEAMKRGFASKPTIYRRIKDGSLSTHLDGKTRVLDVADLVQVFGEPGEDPGRSPATPPVEEAVRLGRLEAELEAAKAEVEHLRRERDKARQEASDEREHGRKREDKLLDMVQATQRLLEDQTKPRSLWQRISGKG